MDNRSRRIMVAVDGSEVALKGVRLAAEMGASVTGLYAHDPRPLHLHNHGYALERDIVAELDRRAHAYAESCVGQVASAAKAAGVACEPLVVRSGRADEAIVKTAKERGCDAIFMASHGHQGLTGVILGSVTQRVLASTSVPVLVFR